MRFTSQKTGIRLPLRVFIALVFGMLILLFGSMIISYNYYENKSITLHAVEDLSSSINAHIAARLNGVYAPIRQFVNISAVGSPSMPASIQDIHELAASFGQAIKLNPSLSSIYLANQGGGFFILRNLTVQQVAGLDHHVPINAQFMAQLIHRSPQLKTVEINLFLDADFKQLGHESASETSYDPRQRDWYQSALNSEQGIISDFYLFFTTREVGFTFAHQLASGQAAIGADITLRQLTLDLAARPFTPSADILLTDRNGLIVAQANSPNGILGADKTGEEISLRNLQDLDKALYLPIKKQLAAIDKQASIEFKANGQKWFAHISAIPAPSNDQLYLTTMAPVSELLQGVSRLRDISILISLALMLFTVLISIRLARHISKPIQQLASAAEQIREFKLDTQVQVSSPISEVSNLSHTMSVMQDSIDHFLKISKALSSEKDFAHLLQLILQEAISVSHAQAGTILLISEDEQHLECAMVINRITHNSLGDTPQGGTELPHHSLMDNDLDSHVVRSGEPIFIAHLDSYHELETFGITERFNLDDYQVDSLLSVPLVNQRNECIGLLQLSKAKSTHDSSKPFAPSILPYIEALSSDAAVALDNRALLKSEEDLLDAFIQVLAGAIDAKSPYTGGHCQRVPVLAHMLSEAAMQSNEPPFADFSMSTEEQRQLHIASWLHDCGKVTTPEHVVDKATRLETIYNRIHEIRMRFEVVWRDTQISHLQARLKHQDSPEKLQADLAQQLDKIRDDFEFIASCNQGSTFMDEDKLQRLQEISRQTWQRQLDDRLGLSAEESDRMPKEPANNLPVTEQLLMDKPQNVIPWPVGAQDQTLDEFTMRRPAYAYNHGEIHNLSISRGTLTNEERYKINEHVIQTLNMLHKMPFPRGLRQVPDWASNHHEQLNGKGYPRSLSAKDLSIPERIMAIADIFEALTASDRPYKTAKTLEQSLKIMQGMSDRGHICPDLFKLFVSSGVYRRYGEAYLN